MAIKKTYLLLVTFLVCFYNNAQQQVVVKNDRTLSEIRTKRAELAIEINHGINFRGELYLKFGTNTSSLTTQHVGTISPTENYNQKTDYLKKYSFSKDDLTQNTKYYYQWLVEVYPVESSPFNISTSTSSFTTLGGFDVLPLQVFEIPEAGLKVGDTIGKLKYDDTDGSWQKIQTFYKTSIGLKTDGTLWAWGRNAQRLIIILNDISK